MKFKKTFLQSRFARRILLIFVTCTIIPLLALFVISYRHITEDLRDQNLRRLKQATKSISISIYERLLFLEAEMQLIGAGISPSANYDLALLLATKRRNESNRFQAMAIFDQNGKKTTLFGATDNFPSLSPTEIRALEKTHATIISQRQSNRLLGVFMVISCMLNDKTRCFILGEINRAYLGQVIADNIYSEMVDFLVLDSSKNSIISSIEPEQGRPEMMGNLIDEGVSGHFSWRFNNRRYRAGYNNLYLKSRYSIADWTVILTQPDDYTLRSVNEYKKIFPLVILLSLLLVIFLCLIFVRKSLIPLEKLKHATNRIVEGNFQEKASIDSGDEFEDLADSFNQMSQKLNLQFNELRLSAAIGHFSAKVMNTDQLMGAIMDSIKEYLNFDRAALLQLNEATFRIGYQAGYGYTASERKAFSFFFFHARRTIDSDNPIEKALLSKKPVVSLDDDQLEIKNTLKGKKFSDETPSGLSIYVPIIYEDKSVGALVFENTSKKRIPVSMEKNFLMGLGSQVAVSLANNASFQKLQESEERFRKAFDHAASGISLISTDGQFLTVNAFLMKMLGYEEKEFLNKTLEAVSDPGHFMAEMSSQKRLFNKELDFDIYEKKFIHKNGHEIWGLVSISLLFDKNDQPLYYIMHVQNLSELKEAEKIQKELKNQLRRSQKNKRISQDLPGKRRN
jgi:PAS domain S-box-containing protein